MRCPSRGSKVDRDIVGKLNIRKRALKTLGIYGGSGPLTAPKQQK